jgi:hypothetical protein
MTHLSVVISYCSGESAFIDALLTQCVKFSDDVVVSFGDKLYDGRPENTERLDEMRTKFPTVQFVSYEVDLSLDLSRARGVRARPTAYWHNLARWTGIVRTRHEWVLLIDADEVPEGDRMRDWLAKAALNPQCCYKRATYWYFKSARFCATTLEDSVLVMNRRHLTEDTVFGDYERDHAIRSSGAHLVRSVVGSDGMPLAHHFSWVRSKTGLAHKIANWAHRDDIFKGADVSAIIDYIYRNDDVNDVVHGYKYVVVPDLFGIGI